MTNGDVSPSSEKIPSRPNIILITGKPENCEAARLAMLDLIPITEEMSIPFEYHGQIIGQKGAFIRQLMEENDVTISIPPAVDRLDKVKIIGPKNNIAGARKALENKLCQLEEGRLDRELKNFKLEVDVPAKYHTQIIGKKGVIISKIREENDVNIKFPEKGNESDDKIIITGYEKNANAAKDAILAKVKELDSMHTEEVLIDYRVHPRIIGAKGRAIIKIMEDFKVDVRFAGPDAEDRDLVTITGLEDNVFDCKDHLQNLEEEYLQELEEREEYRSMHRQQQNEESPQPKGQQGSQPPQKGNQNSKGFTVRDAPWCQAPAFTNEEFPDLGLGAAAAPAKPPGLLWGPSSKVSR
jgi:hypothetical protein